MAPHSFMVHSVAGSLVAILCTLFTGKFANCSKIILLPLPWPSHFAKLEMIGVELHRRGHNVIIGVPSSETYAARTPLPKVVYNVEHAGDNPILTLHLRHFKSEAGNDRPWMVDVVEILLTFGEALMTNEELSDHAKTADLVFSDTVFLPGQVFAAHHSLPIVLLSTCSHFQSLNGGLLGVAVNPSYIPYVLGRSHLGIAGAPQYMNYFERQMNMISALISLLGWELHINPTFSVFSRKYSNESLNELTRKTSLVLVSLDYSFEYARLDPPNVKLIGALTPRKTKTTLDSPFSDIIKSSGANAILLVSFGTVQIFDEKTSTRILKALEGLNHTVIMKYDMALTRHLRKNEVVRDLVSPGELTFWGEDSLHEKRSASCDYRNWPEARKSQTKSKKPAEASENFNEKNCLESTTINEQRRRQQGVQLENRTFIFGWLPQQELLQNVNGIVLFSHCGVNSVYEALFHGRVIICMPVFGDQFDNAGHVLSRKVGRVLHLHSFSKEKLEVELRILINDKSYLENVRKISRRLKRNLMPPTKMAAFWIESVLAEGGDMDFLKPACSKMSLHEYLCLDIIAFWIVSFGLLAKLIHCKIRG